MTANEIHVPVGKPVRVKVETDDVIHSFWPPSLNGKIDLINNQQNELEFTAEREGVYRGQCAEFCGLQHAHMGFEIVAETPGKFRALARTHNLPTRPGGGGTGRGCFFATRAAPSAIPFAARSRLGARAPTSPTSAAAARSPPPCFRAMSAISPPGSPIPNISSPAHRCRACR